MKEVNNHKSFRFLFVLNYSNLAHGQNMGESWIMCIELENYWIPFAHVSLQSYHLLYHLNWSFIACNHDLANQNMPPLALMPYHSMSVPEPFTLLEFNNLAIGHTVRTWNSPEEISIGIWDLIVQSNILCPQCSWCYSIDGFYAHIEDETCTNSQGPVLFNWVHPDKFPVSLIYPSNLTQNCSWVS